ncbi:MULTISPECIES: outer membrane protein assembly factor BamE [unclassified Pseudoalteromonas]|uniref:outer membrane protein assembly factor BamE n=1 Tax=unclassified Pseudoalteromonas TaxID=194690 RepID=UPI000CF716E2|nr:MULTISPECIES: outer membrane protein assembly factor BamE [unclassified Pseudoalteromonas]
MQWFKQFSLVAAIVIVCSSLSACSSWVYRINIPQGNFLEQSDVDKLRVDMTREQVLYVLGKPVAEDAFDKDTWYYLYVFNLGREFEQRKQLKLKFANDRLASISSEDYEQPEDFNTPLEQ